MNGGLDVLFLFSEINFISMNEGGGEDCKTTGKSESIRGNTF